MYMGLSLPAYVSSIPSQHLDGKILASIAIVHVASFREFERSLLHCNDFLILIVSKLLLRLMVLNVQEALRSTIFDERHSV